MNSMNLNEKYKGHETPAYTVHSKKGDIEIRDYPAMLIAQTTVSAGSRDQAVNQAFRILAGYIFGANTGRQSISMTTPVFSERTSQKLAMTSPVTFDESGSYWRMQFMMPSTYSLVTLPKPEDGRIEFSEKPAERLVVLKFSGVNSQDNFDRHQRILEEFIMKERLTVLSQPRYMVYDSPFTLPFYKRNEIAFVVIREGAKL